MQASERKPDAMTATKIADSRRQSGVPVRLAAWASLALLSGVSAYYLYQHPIQVGRSETVAVADPMKQVQQLAQQQALAATKDVLVEVRRLSAAVGTLNTDRDRLYSRLNALEQSIDSITGSLAKQTAVVSSPNVTSVPAATSDTGRLNPTMPSSDTSTVESTASIAEAPVARTSFGVDLGTAPNVEGLRALWRKDISTSNALASLQPIVAVRERPGVAGVNLRLVAGPLTDAAAAARLCATLTAGVQRPCEPSVYDGQRLAMDVASPPAAPRKKPAPLRLPSAPRPPSNTPQILPR